MMSKAIAAGLALLPLAATAADSDAHLRPALFMTGNVVWPSRQGMAIEGDGENDVVTLRDVIPAATIGPAAVRGAYRVVYVSRGATVGRFHVDGLRAQVTDACIRAHADVVVVRNTHCAMTGGPQRGGVNMPFGLQITSATSVDVEDSSFDGFRWRAAANRYWNGDGITIERGVATAQFHRVSADGNTDAGFDVRPHAILSDVSASGNCRNFRFWAGADVGTLMTGDAVKRGGISACSGIWLNGSADGARPKLHIRKLIVRMSHPGTIIQVESGPADIRIDQCDIRAPAGTSMIRFEKGAGEVRLGRGCEVPNASS